MDDLVIFGKDEKENTVAKQSSAPKDEKGAKKPQQSRVKKSAARRHRSLEPVEDVTQLFEGLVTQEELDRYKNPDREMGLAAKNSGLPLSADDVNERWENATLSDDYLFGAVMCDKELCSELLYRILPKLGKLTIVSIHGQRVVEGGFGFRGMRLDVYAEDENGNVYDIEMQVGNNKKSLPKRMRFYQGSLDATYLDKGEGVELLPKTYIIFICCFDPFDKGRMLYTFETYCTEDKELKLGDETIKVVLNAQGISEDSKLKVFSDFIMDKPVVDDDFIEKLKFKIRAVKDDRKYRKGYLMYCTRLVNDDLKEIKEYGEEKLNEGRLRSIAKMISRADEKMAREILDATDDEINEANRMLLNGEVDV